MLCVKVKDKSYQSMNLLYFKGYFKDPSVIIGVQETHFKDNNAKGMAILAKFKTRNSTYDGDGNRQKGTSIFFCVYILMKRE